jgi:hypothetical protein
LCPSVATWYSWIIRKSGIFPGRNGEQNDDGNHERLKSVTPIKLQQRHIIKFLPPKALKLGDIAAKLSSVYGLDVDARSSIKCWLHQLRLGRKDFTTQHVGGRRPRDDTSTEILSVLKISPLSSGRTIVGSLDIPASTVYWHFVEKIGFNNSLLHWVPHRLTDELRQNRIELAGQSLERLKANEAPNSMIL